MSWEQAWNEGRTPWDQGASSPALEELVANDEVPNGRGLVPGCGSGYDVLTLASAERHVTGIDLSEVAKERFEILRAKAQVSPNHARVITADFFTFQASPFDFVWDYTFLCAIEPEMRSAWQQKVHSLLKPNGSLFVLVFPTAPLHDDPNRPPYVLSTALITEVLGPSFRLQSEMAAQNSLGNRSGKEILARWSRL